MFGFRFIKFQPNEYVLKYHNGNIVKEGVGLSFHYYVPTTSVVVIPMGSVDIPFIFEEVTSDFQTVSIQGQITFRIIDQKRIAKLLNYTLNLKGQGYKSDDPQKLPQRILNMVRVLAKKQLQALSLKEAVQSSEGLAKNILQEIKETDEIEFLGIEILGLSILAILPNKETARALEAEAREEILKKADEAIYIRRNASIDQERHVKENEFNTEIAIENKKREVKETQIEALRIVQQKENQLKDEQLNFETIQEEKKKAFVEKLVLNNKALSESKAYELQAMMKSLEGINPNVIQSLASIGMAPDKLIAIAFQSMAENANKIGQLNISPDLLNQLLKGNDNEPNNRK